MGPRLLLPVAVLACACVGVVGGSDGGAGGTGGGAVGAGGSGGASGGTGGGSGGGALGGGAGGGLQGGQLGGSAGGGLQGGQLGGSSGGVSGGQGGTAGTLGGSAGGASGGGLRGGTVGGTGGATGGVGGGTTGGSVGAAGSGGGLLGGVSGGTAGGASGGSGGGGGSTFDGGLPIPIPGQAPYDRWTWVPFSDAICANGSTVGLGINPHAGSDDLVIDLAGGGVCWNNDTCWVNRTAYGLDGYTEANFARTVQYELGTGIFDRNDVANPFRTFNYVWLPYCTGDLHMGNRTTQYSGGTIRHVGFRNMAAFLRRIVPTFSSVRRIVLSGRSAGGFGATWNYRQVRAAFASQGHPFELILVDDSGPYLRDPYYTVAIQQAFETSFGASLNQPGCTACDPNVLGGGLYQVVPFLATDPGFRGSLICSLYDNSIRDVLSRPPGNPLLNCTSDPGSCLIAPGVQDFRTGVASSAAPGRFKVFYLDGDDHVWLGAPLSSVVSNGVSLASFLAAQLDGGTTWNNVVP